MPLVNFKYAVRINITMNKEILVIGIFLSFLFGILVVSALDNQITLSPEMNGAQKIIENGDVFWKTSLTPQNGTLLIRLPPNVIIVKSSVNPASEEFIAQKYLLGLITVYQGKEIAYNSSTPLEIVYKEMDSFEKFSNFFKI